MKNKILPFIIMFIALGLSGTAAYYSIIGLSKLFAGVAFAVILMASFLEASKLVIASLLYQYWENLNKILRAYLTVALIVLILITSMGIYGMLSSGYQETYSELAVVENKKEFLNKKIEFYEKDLARYDKELETILININNLSTAKARSIQVRDTSSSTGVRNTISTSELRLAQKRIAIEDENKNKIQVLRQKTSDSLQKYKLEVLNLSNNSETAGELGPLKYLSGLTGAPMDRIINILLLVIIFVFDPLAISLVVAANFAFEKAFPKKKEKLFEELEDDFSEWEDLDEDNYPEPNEVLKDAVERYKDLGKEQKQDEDKPKTSGKYKEYAKQHPTLQSLINNLERRLKEPLSSWKQRKLRKELERLKLLKDKDDEDVKIY